MLHLFEKTYLDIDAFIDMNENRVVLSELYGTPVWSVVEQTTSGELLAYGSDPDTLFADGDQSVDSYAALFDVCYEKTQLDGRKVIIYADKSSYNKIFSAFCKLVFSNISASSAYDIIKANFARDILLGGRETFLLTNQVVNAKPTEAEFTTAFNSITIDVAETNNVNIFEKIKSKLSLEYTLASYFVDPANYKERLKPIMFNMLTRWAEETTKEAYRSFQASIFDGSLRSQLGISTVYDLDNIEDLLNEPVLEVLKTTNTWRAAAGVGIAREPLDLTVFTSEQISTLKDQVCYIKFFMNGSYDQATIDKVFSRVLLYIDILAKGTISDQDLIDIIDYDLTNRSDDDRFWSGKDRSQVNLYLIEDLLVNKSAGNTAAITPYLLRT